MKTALVCATLFAVGSYSGEAGRQAFVKSWEGRTVVCTPDALFARCTTQRGTLGTSRSGRLDGLVVVTPSNGVYFRFGGRQGREDVETRDVQRIVRSVNEAYAPDEQDVRPYRKVEALAINRFEPGVELVVRHVSIERDEVVFSFSASGRGDRDEPVTTLRIKWPLPISRKFSECSAIEKIIREFLAAAPEV